MEIQQLERKMRAVGASMTAEQRRSVAVEARRVVLEGRRVTARAELFVANLT